MSTDQPSFAENPLVSIVIPCYKQGHFLREAIESCLYQTYPNLEIIVIDDGSPDDTTKVATSFANVLCLRQQNQGLAASRNRGLRESKGEYLIFLDADDRLKPSAVELGLKHLVGNRSAAFAYGRCHLIDRDGRFLSISNQPIVRSNHYERLLSRSILPNPGGIMFRRRSLEEAGGFNPEVPGAEDYDLCLRLSRLYDVCFYDDIVSDYRQHEEGLSRKATIMAESVHKVLKAQEPFVQDNKQYKKALRNGMKYWRKNHYSTALVFRLNQSARNKRWRAIPSDFVLLLRTNPHSLFVNAFRKIGVEVKNLFS